MVKKMLQIIVAVILTSGANSLYSSSSVSISVSSVATGWHFYNNTDLAIEIQSIVIGKVLSSTHFTAKDLQGSTVFQCASQYNAIQPAIGLVLPRTCIDSLDHMCITRLISPVKQVFELVGEILIEACADLYSSQKVSIS